jgi:sugar/nucleoside kinase (ribokinase family)
MKNEILHLAATLLSPEEQDLLARLGDLQDEDGLTVALDMDIRAGMCDALADMSESLRSLLGLMARHHFLANLPDNAFPAYNELMERIGTAASNANDWVQRSRALDQHASLAIWPEASAMQQ